MRLLTCSSSSHCTMAGDFRLVIHSVLFIVQQFNVKNTHKQPAAVYLEPHELIPTSATSKTTLEADRTSLTDLRRTRGVQECVIGLQHSAVAAAAKQHTRRRRNLSLVATLAALVVWQDWWPGSPWVGDRAKAARTQGLVYIRALYIHISRAYLYVHTYIDRYVPGTYHCCCRCLPRLC